MREKYFFKKIMLIRWFQAGCAGFIHFELFSSNDRFYKKNRIECVTVQFLYEKISRLTVFAVCGGDIFHIVMRENS